MIKHIVMWQFHDPASANKFKELLDSCQTVVPGILEWDVGIRHPKLEANVDVVLVSTFADKASLDAYQEHPHHLAVKGELAKLRSSRTVLDYPTQALVAADVDLGRDLSFAPTVPGSL